MAKRDQRGLFDGEVIPAKARAEPLPPFQRHSETSRAGAVAILPKVGTRRRQVYDSILSAGRLGATDEEGQLRLRMNGNTYRPRRGELARVNLIEQSSTRRTGAGQDAVVWVAVQ